MIVITQNYLGDEKDNAIELLRRIILQSKRRSRIMFDSKLLGIHDADSNVAVFIDREGSLIGRYSRGSLHVDEDIKFTDLETAVLLRIAIEIITP